MCSETLRTTEESSRSLEAKCSNQESELTELRGNLLKSQEDLQNIEKQNRSLQDTVLKERTNGEVLEQAKLEIQAKLDTVASEKSRLLTNLDDYVEKLANSESREQSLTEECMEKTSKISELEARLQQLEGDCEDLSLRLKSSEEDLEHKIEESDTVKNLREAMKILEDELGEKKQVCFFFFFFALS